MTTTKLLLSEIFPTKTRIRLVAVWLIVILFLLFGQSILGDTITGTIALGTFLVLLFTIIGAAFGVVKEADELAHKLGEPYGTLILTLSIVSIEVILIAAVMLGPGENPTIGKDSIFSVMMIIMNLVIGLCILLGGLKFGEQEYNAQGTLSYMGMIIMLGGIGLLLPNFIQGAGGGQFTTIQAVVLAGLVILLYGFFLLLQMKRYKHLYIQPKAGNMEILFVERHEVGGQEEEGVTESVPVDKREIWIRTLILLGMILPIVLLSHNMAVVVDYGIKAANLPPLLGGVLIAIIVFTPESMTAVKAALNNEFQRAINLCHGAFVSTVGLTIPAVLIVGLITGKTVLFGMTPTETILFVITLLLSLMTFIGKRTTPIMGMMHLVLFVVFMLLIFNP
ncbi:calcium:proton antiporter [Myroides sp. 1354]|uniref:calcium:proton antiporter n=1 Tax=unclassified Myroides TaxID=2642485 RepID=UPI002577F3E3|nr:MULTISPECIES: calcium:proton antiporter [unclassified Myroides]MDM1044785.1 calcium:proton antiporter [Myroides sp. R163-1]MDM1055498.1 calcium:proton antiporter [Myroides sp. 1354]MDM1068795.1 calcium:proton antiporter [Myroides sp. 1372]